jgi:transcriptional regulator with XRE-family HTH domain
MEATEMGRYRVATGKPSTPEGELKDLGARLRYYRETVLKDKLRDIAARSKISENTLRKLESGDGNPRFQVLLKAITKGYKLKNLQDALSRPRSAVDEGAVVVFGGLEGIKTNQGFVPYQLGPLSYYLLELRPNDPQMEVAIGRLPPGKKTDMVILDNHGGDEVVIGLRGVTQVVRTPRDGPEESHEVRAGQVLIHRASVDHYARNPSPRHESVYLAVRAPCALMKPTERSGSPESA